MFKRMSIMVVLALLVASVLAACGGGAPAPVTLSSLPVFTGAAESTNETMVATVQQSVEAAKADTTVKGVEIKAYDLPEGTTFDALKSFFTPALEKAGWTSVASPNAALLVFSRGNQQFAITHVEPLNAIMVMLAEKK